MAVDYFLKIDGIAGESQDAKHKGEIDVLSFSWGVSQTATGKGGGGGAGKATFTDFAIIKTVDTATPQLMQACCTGEHITEANFTARKAGETQLEYMKIKLTDILISSVQPGGSTGAVPMEQVSFSFGDALIIVVSQKADGSAGQQVSQILCGGSKR